MTGAVTDGILEAERGALGASLSGYPLACRRGSSSGRGCRPHERRPAGDGRRRPAAGQPRQAPRNHHGSSRRAPVVGWPGGGHPLGRRAGGSTGPGMSSAIAPRGAAAKARVDEEKRIVLDDPGALGLAPGDTGEVFFMKTGAHRPRRRMRGLRKGTHTSAQAIDEVRRSLSGVACRGGRFGPPARVSPRGRRGPSRLPTAPCGRALTPGLSPAVGGGHT